MESSGSPLLQEKKQNRFIFTTADSRAKNNRKSRKIQIVIFCEFQEHLAKNHQERRRESITYEYKKLTYHRYRYCVD